MKYCLVQAQNFDIAIKSDVGGRLHQWKQAYPIVIEHIQKMILGYKPKASEETTEGDNLRDLFNQDIVQKNPEPLGKFCQ